MIQKASEIPRILFEEISKEFGKASESVGPVIIFEKRDDADEICEIRFGKDCLRRGYVSFWRDKFGGHLSRFSFWTQYPGHENTHTREWFSPKAIIGVIAGFQDTGSWNSIDGNVYRENIRVKFGWYNDELDLSDIEAAGFATEIIMRAANLATGYECERKYARELFPERFTQKSAEI